MKRVVGWKRDRENERGRDRDTETQREGGRWRAREDILLRSLFKRAMLCNTETIVTNQT